MNSGNDSTSSTSLAEKRHQPLGHTSLNCGRRLYALFRTRNLPHNLGGSTIYTLARLPSSHELQHSIGPVTILWGSASRLRLVYPNYLALSLYHLLCGCLRPKHCWKRKPKKTLTPLLSSSTFCYTLAFSVIAYGQ